MMENHNNLIVFFKCTVNGYEFRVLMNKLLNDMSVSF